MNIRRAVTSDVDAAREWLIARNWPTGHLDALPSLGYTVTSQGEILVMGWIYIDRENKIACLAWIMANPANTPRQSYQALKMLQRATRDEATVRGVPLLIAPAQRGIAKTLKSAGWGGSEQTTLMMTKTR